jgi:hypothetical protein
MKQLFLLTFLFGAILNSASAGDKITAKDIMSKIDAGRISWEIEPAVRTLAIATLMKIGEIKEPRQLSEKLIAGTEQALVKQFQAQYIYFQPAMANVRYIQDGAWRYSVTFDFHTTRKCTFRAEKIDHSCGNPICNPNVENPSQHQNIDKDGTIIPDSYCEKLYNLKIAPQGNIQPDNLIGVPSENK